MNEDFLQYAWAQRLFLPDLTTRDGLVVDVLSVGIRNDKDGPDFFNAKIVLDGMTWVGNIEIHDRASDWFRHGHDLDRAYDNVILHVVRHADTVVRRPSGEEIPQVELRIPDHIVKRYQTLQSASLFVPCAQIVGKVNKATLRNCLDRCLVERLRHKTAAMQAHLEQNGGDWREAFYILLARGLGFGVNGEAMEQLAKSLPLSVIGKHKDNRLQVEALLMGQSGLIDRFATSAPLSADRLRMEYLYLSKKFSLRPIDNSLWKFKTRPANSPIARIGILADLVTRMDGVLSRIIENPNVENAYGAFATSDASDNLIPVARLGRQSIESLIINAVVPSLFLYGKLRDKQSLCDKSLDILSSLSAESNNITKRWASVGIIAENAADSQALLELKTSYCDLHDCLRCTLSRPILCEP